MLWSESSDSQKWCQRHTIGSLKVWRAPMPTSACPTMCVIWVDTFIFPILLVDPFTSQRPLFPTLYAKHDLVIYCVETEGETWTFTCSIALNLLHCYSHGSQIKGRYCIKWIISEVTVHLFSFACDVNNEHQEKSGFGMSRTPILVSYKTTRETCNDSQSKHRKFIQNRKLAVVTTVVLVGAAEFFYVVLLIQ